MPGKPPRGEDEIRDALKRFERDPQEQPPPVGEAAAGLEQRDELLLHTFRNPQAAEHFCSLLQSRGMLFTRKASRRTVEVHVDLVEREQARELLNRALSEYPDDARIVPRQRFDMTIFLGIAGVVCALPFGWSGAGVVPAFACMGYLSDRVGFNLRAGRPPLGLTEFLLLVPLVAAVGSGLVMLARYFQALNLDS